MRADAARDPDGDMAQALVEQGVLTRRDLATMTPEFNKPASKPCPHQKRGVGCTIYARRPFGCHVWNCRWLVNDDCDDQQRPDRSGFVIDLLPDYVQLQDNATGELRAVQVVQIWAKHRDVINDSRLRAYLLRRGSEGIAALIRFNERDAVLVVPPTLAEDRQWHIRDSGDPNASHRPQHSLEEVRRALGGGPLRIGLMP